MIDDLKCRLPEAIYLEPPCSASDTGSLWAADDPFDRCEDCGNTGTKFIRADVADAKLAAKEKECARFARTLKHIADYGDVGSDSPCGVGKYCCRNEVVGLARAALAGGA